jgi:ATP-dependent DNA helicase PIF1
MELIDEQQVVFELIETSAGNMLITGRPGVGKTVLINHLIQEGKKIYTIAAPTGLAALNINGAKTLHSLFQIPISKGILTNNYDIYEKSPAVMNHLRYRVKHLIIDECSMVRADVLDYINRLLMYAKGNNFPFGGVQIIMFGDFYQLPPVVQALERKQLRDEGYETPFVFSAKSFVGFKVIELTKVLRQKDKSFLDILEAARTGIPTFRQIANLNSRLLKETDAIRLMPTNKDADQYNTSLYNKLTTRERVYKASVTGDWPAFPCPEILRLKVGCKVMVKKNGADQIEIVGGSSIVNGTIGTVEELHEDSVVISNEKGKYTIYEQQFTQSVKVHDEINGWKEVIIASFVQIPLQLAWAVSIHKSQGQTFEKCAISTNKIFAAGQLYVALSRCKTLEGIVLEKPVLKRHFIINKDVAKFYKQLNNGKKKQKR